MVNSIPESVAIQPADNLGPLRLSEAYEATAHDRHALSEEDLVPVRVDVVAAVVTTLGCIPKLAPFRQPIVTGIPMFEIAHFDKLESYALALMHAHTQYQAAARSSGPSEPISAELLPIREMLLADVTALEARKLLDGRRGELRGPTGYKNQASDVLLLVSVLRSKWAAISGRTAVTQAELDHAELLSERMLAALGAREQGPKNAKPEAEARSRAYTLFVRGHVEVRRVISFLRWHEDDLDAIFPTVFGGKSKPEAVNKSGSQSGEESGPSLTDRGGGDGRPSPLPAGPDGKAVPGGLAGGEPFDS